PGGFAAVHARRRTPWAAIAFTTALVLGLAAGGGVRALGGTTALLLLCVFALVNVAVLVLRRQPSDRPHYRAPVVVPLFGVGSCCAVSRPSGRVCARVACWRSSASSRACSSRRRCPGVILSSSRSRACCSRSGSCSGG